MRKIKKVEVIMTVITKFKIVEFVTLSISIKKKWLLHLLLLEMNNLEKMLKDFFFPQNENLNTWIS